MTLLLTENERRLTFSLAAIYAMRMLGVFMIFPIFSLYMHDLRYATPMLMGLALGIYGLTQALLQIPFGMWSDRVGRKPVIVIGLLLMILGSVMAAESNNIYWIIIARAIQGTGAVGSVLTAFVADGTSEKSRLKAMSVIGMTIGLAFMLAMVAGPIFNSWVGLSGIFWLTAGFGVVSIGIVFLASEKQKPGSPIKAFGDDEPKASGNPVIKKQNLWPLNIGIFCLHAILTALFIAIPLILIHPVGLAENQAWKLYLPVLLIAFIAMVPFIILAEKKGQMKNIFRGAVIILTLVSLAFWALPQSLWWVGFLLVLFFIAFTFLEAALPSLISKRADPASKGRAMGIYSSAQFLGILAGGVLGGLVFHYAGLASIFLFCAGIGILWFLLTMIDV